MEVGGSKFQIAVGDSTHDFYIVTRSLSSFTAECRESTTTLMTILDRYLLMTFVRIFLVCFLSFTGLYVVIHMFSNLDELAELSKESSWGQLLWEFYSPRMAEMFDKTAPIMALVAGIFSVHLMQRNSELTAIEAGGITKARALRSVLIAGLIVVGMTIANREFLIPRVRDSLVRTPQNWDNDGDVEMATFVDPETGIRIRGNEFLLSPPTVTRVNVQLPLSMSPSMLRISAVEGLIEPAVEGRPGGMRMMEVVEPLAIDQMETIYHEQQPVVLTAREFDWIEPGQCFLVMELDADEIAYGKRMAQYRTTSEMISALHRPKTWFGKDEEVEVHARILKPALDLSMILIGLPLIVASGERNIFVSSGLGFLIVGGIFLTDIACKTMGAYHLLQPASLAAWLPLMIFVPFAVVSLRKLSQ